MFKENPNYDILNKFKNVRKQTVKILEPLEIEDYIVQTDVFMSPPRWHLGHVSWFYEQLLKKYYTDYKPFKNDYSKYLNSYYNAFGEPFDKSKRGTVSRPTVSETFDYWTWINQQVNEFIINHALSAEMVQMFVLGFNHEWQHQELLMYDIQHLLQDNFKAKETIINVENSNNIKRDMISIPGGIFELGFDSTKYPDQFAYDIEMPVHKVYLNDYSIDNTPVTNGEYLEFIKDGGYENYKFWLSDGWAAVKKLNWKAPLYWHQNEYESWQRAELRGIKNIDEIKDEPVTNISYYEADAYAKWAGKRLPTEAEWEKAAAWDEDKNIKRLYPWGDDPANSENANLLENNLYGTAKIFSYPKGKSYFECYGLIGDTWEWTQSEFMGYPGYKTGFAEYNDKWFGNQKVLKGGSFGTPRESTRNTYRNFFRCEDRWLFSGFRCAK